MQPAAGRARGKPKTATNQPTTAGICQTTHSTVYKVKQFQPP